MMAIALKDVFQLSKDITEKYLEYSGLSGFEVRCSIYEFSDKLNLTLFKTIDIPIEYRITNAPFTTTLGDEINKIFRENILNSPLVTDKLREKDEEIAKLQELIKELEDKSQKDEDAEQEFIHQINN